MATQWWRIKAAYLEKNMTYRELAEHYRVSERTIRTRASKEGWRKERDKIETEARQEFHARAVRGRVEQLEKLIEANDLVIDGILEMAKLIKDKPKIYLRDEKRTLKNADSMTKAIQTAAMTQRDLHKLPTLDQDLARKQENLRRKEIKQRMAIEQEKWEAEKAEKAETSEAMNGAVIRIEMPEGEDPVDE